MAKMALLVVLFASLSAIARPRASIAPIAPPPSKLVGDVNGDGKVNIIDLALACRIFGATPADPRWLPNGPNADLNNNNMIDIDDIHMIATHFTLFI